MIADEIKNKILSHIEKHFSEEEVSIASSKFQIEIPDSPEKGDLTCNIALILGNMTKSNPKEPNINCIILGKVIFFNLPQDMYQNIERTRFQVKVSWWYQNL